MIIVSCPENWLYHDYECSTQGARETDGDMIFDIEYNKRKLFAGKYTRNPVNDDKSDWSHSEASPELLKHQE